MQKSNTVQHSNMVAESFTNLNMVDQILMDTQMSLVRQDSHVKHKHLCSLGQERKGAPKLYSTQNYLK